MYKLRHWVKGIVHFEIIFWYVLAYLKGIQNVCVLVSTVFSILIFFGQTVVVYQSYNGGYKGGPRQRACTEKSKLNMIEWYTLGHQCVLTFTSHSIMFNLDFSVLALWRGPPKPPLYDWQTTTVWPKNIKIENTVETKTPTSWMHLR